MSISRRHFVIGAAATAAAASPFLGGRTSRAAQPIKIRVSIDTNLQQSRAKGILWFGEELRKRSNNELEIELFHSAQLFNDKDVPRALRRGSIEMGAVGTWLLDGFVPESGVTMMPVIYGLPQNIIYKLVDGKLGDMINDKIEKGLDVKIIGKWTDAGFQHTFSGSKAINRHEDMRSLKIRIPGGSWNSFRYKAMGANPVVVPFADLPMALQQGTIDGLQTSIQSAHSAKLPEAGLKYCFLDRHYFAQYLPMLGRGFWNKLKPSHQTAILESWAAVIERSREEAAQSDLAARRAMEAANVTFVQPSDAVLAQWRQKMTAQQDTLVKQLNIDPDLVAAAVREVKRLSS